MASRPGRGLPRPGVSNRVTGGQTTQVPDLVLQRPKPVLQGVYPLLEAQKLSAMPPGAAVDLRGLAFGASKGKPCNVSLKGVPIPGSNRSANDLIVARIPEDTESGLLAIQVDGFETNGLPVRVIGQVEWLQPTLRLAKGEDSDWSALIQMYDQRGASSIGPTHPRYSESSSRPSPTHRNKATTRSCSGPAP